jgi:hypothetical protein
VDVEDSLVFDVKDTKDEEKEFKDIFIEKLDKEELTDFTPEGRDNKVSLSKSVKPIVSKKKKSRTVFAKKIQPNKTAAEEQTQQGWSLHHSEMECFVFARRRGWEIVAIYIDRDCCPVCASTLKWVDKEEVEEKEEKVKEKKKEEKIKEEKEEIEEIDDSVHTKIYSFFEFKNELKPEKKMEIYIEEK